MSFLVLNRLPIIPDFVDAFSKKVDFFLISLTLIKYVSPFIYFKVKLHSGITKSKTAYFVLLFRSFALTLQRIAFATGKRPFAIKLGEHNTGVHTIWKLR